MRVLWRVAERTDSKAKTVSKAKTGAAARVTLVGDPAKVLAIRLPVGVWVASVSPALRQKLRDAHKGLGSPKREMRSSETGTPDANAKVSSASVIDKQAFEPDARSRALLRGRKIAEADLRASGGAYNLEDVRTLLQGVSRQRIDKQVREGSLLAVPGPSNRRHYPTVQFQADGTVVKGLRAVREALPTRNPWAVLNFLVQPDARLNGRKPIELLKAGAVDDVVDAARSIGLQGG